MSVKLRKITINDLEQIMRWRMSEEVSKYMYTDPVLNLDNQYQWFIKTTENSLFEKYWIIEIDDGIPVGLMSINNIDKQNHQASWAYYIGSVEARGKGLGRILECNMYDFAFETMGLHKLWCEVFQFNESVISIHQKFGSKIEGVLIDHIYKNNEYYNVVRMSILSHEWKQRKLLTPYEKMAIEV